MINFKTFLAEARMAPLYHGTSMKFFASITDNGFEPRTLHVPKKLLKTTGNHKIEFGSNNPWGAKETLDYVRGISTTRNFKFADDWGKAGSERGWAVFEFDQQKLTHRYQIKPIQYFVSDYGKSRFQGNDKKNEFEEFIISTKNIPLTFVKTIHYFVDPLLGADPVYMKALANARKKYPHINFKPLKGSESLD